MKGESLFVERPTELREPVAEEKDSTIKCKLAVLKCFSPGGRALEAVCHEFGIAVSTGSLWLRPWKAAGDAGSSAQGQRTGRPPHLDEWDLGFLNDFLPQQTPWTTAEGRQLMQRAWGIASSPAQGIRLLRARLGLPFSNPLPRASRRPPAAAARVTADRHQGLMRLTATPMTQADIARGLRDATRPQQRANPGRGWRFEARPVVDKNPTHCKRKPIGCDASPGGSVQALLATATEEAMGACLQQLTVAKSAANAIVIRLDK